MNDFAVVQCVTDEILGMSYLRPIIKMGSTDLPVYGSTLLNIKTAPTKCFKNREQLRHKIV